MADADIKLGGSLLKDPNFLMNKIEMRKNAKKDNLRKSTHRSIGLDLN